VTNKLVVQLVSRAVALNLVIWAVESLVYIPEIIFSLSHYAGLEVHSANQAYFYRYDYISLVSHLVYSTGLFLAAVWVYGCGPTLERFLLPSEE